MSEYLELGPSPDGEECAQVGSADYSSRARAECLAYIQAIRRLLGQEPEGASLAIKSFPHDFGNYYEVVCYYEESIPGSVDYAFLCESQAPETWAEAGMKAPTIGQKQQHFR